jgi:hypothetical protein
MAGEQVKGRLCRTHEDLAEGSVEGAGRPLDNNSQAAYDAGEDGYVRNGVMGNVEAGCRYRESASAEPQAETNSAETPDGVVAPHTVLRARAACGSASCRMLPHVERKARCSAPSLCRSTVPR